MKRLLTGYIGGLKACFRELREIAAPTLLVLQQDDWRLLRVFLTCHLVFAYLLGILALSLELLPHWPEGIVLGGVSILVFLFIGLRLVWRPSVENSG